MPVQRDAQPSNGSEYVEFERVSKSFDGRTMVVRDLDLQIRKGEFLTLLGPSGSGKTTCLMMLAGFETPTSGPPSSSTAAPCTTCRPGAGASAWCSRTTRCSRT